MVDVHVSDATPEVAMRMAQLQDAWPEAVSVRTDRLAEELAAGLEQSTGGRRTTTTG